MVVSGCGKVSPSDSPADASGDAVASDSAPSVDAELVCASGTRACAGQCAANTSPVWSFNDHVCGPLGGACLTGSTCQNGACVPATVSGILEADYTRFKPVGPELVVAAGALYWGGASGYSGGCDPANGGCATGGPLGGYFAVAIKLLATDGGNFLYFTYPESNELWVLNRMSTGSSKVTGNLGGANGLAVDGAGNVFFTNEAGQVLVLTGGMGAPAALIGSGPAKAQKLVVVGSTLYYTAWGAGATTGEVRAVPVGGAGAFTTLASNQAQPTYLAVFENRIYWTNQGDGTVWTLELGRAGAVPALIATGQNKPLGIAADASAVYWVNQGSGDVMKAMVCGGSVLAIARSQSTPTEIAILGGNLYWTAVGANQVMTMPE